MTSRCISSVIVLLGAVTLTGCEFDNGIALRAKEKPEVYASLQVWQKRFIEKGVVARGFTPDMVYIAMGAPTKVETRARPLGNVEFWTYLHYYPNITEAHGSTFNGAEYSTHSPYQGQFKATQDASGDPHSSTNPQMPVGMTSTPPSLFKTGPPQGGTMEPGNMFSYTFIVVFEEGKVTRVGSYPDPN